MNREEILEIRKDFPLRYGSKREKIVYLDNAATSQRPLKVIKAVDHYCKYKNATNIGAHYLSDEFTRAYEKSRITVQKFINAKKSSEIIFTRSATESLNLIAYSYGIEFLNLEMKF